MSEIGALSHAYAEWNAHLTQMNSWLLSIRKMKEGLLQPPPKIDIPEDVKSVLSNIAETLNPSSQRQTASVPLTIKRKLSARLDDEETASRRLFELMELAPFPIGQLNKEDIDLLRVIVASLDDEVSSLYNRMRRHR